MALPTPLPKYRQIYLQPPRFVLVTPTAAKTQKLQTNVGGWVLRSGREQLRETGSIPAAPPATSKATNPRQHQPKDLSKPRRDIHLVEISIVKTVVCKGGAADVVGQMRLKLSFQTSCSVCQLRCQTCPYQTCRF